MEGKRRIIVDPNTDQVPHHKRNRTLRVKDGITEQGNEIKSEENDEGILYPNHRSITTVDDFHDQVKDEPVEVKDEPVEQTGSNGPGLDIHEDEKPILFEVPVELDVVDPLRPLNVNREVKDEPTEEKVKNENDDGFGQTPSASGINSSAEDIEIKPQVHDDIPKARSGNVSHNVRLRYPRGIPQFQISASECQKAFEIPTSHSWVPQQSSNSGPQIVLSRHQKGDSELAPGPNNLQNSTVKVEYPAEDVGVKNHIEPHGLYARPSFEEVTPQPSSKPPAHAGKSDNVTSKDSDKNSIVQLLDQTHFLLEERTKEQEDKIIQTGRPTPLMMRIRHPKNYVTGFWATMKDYQLIPWLTGLASHNRYYCWPCLIFTKERWTVSGGVSQKNFWDALKQHISNPLHQAAYENLKLRESELKAAKNNGSTPDDIVRTNRDFLALLIRILGFKKNNLPSTDANFGGFEELMEVVICYKPELLKFVGKPLRKDVLTNFVSRHASKLLSSLEAKIAVRINNEFRKSQFVSIVYEDTESIVHRSSQVAVIVRLLNDDGDISERFLKFVTIGPSRRAHDILETHLAVIEELGIKEKLVGFTFSGTVVAPSSIAEFISTVTENSPRARFFHHPDHNLKELLLQSLSHIEGCQRFLEIISDLVKFFTNPGVIPKLVAFIKGKSSNCQRLDDATSFTINLISTIRQYLPLIDKFFSEVSRQSWNDESATQAATFVKFLREPFNRYLIVVIAAVLDAVEDLSKLMEEDYNSAEWETQADKVLDKIEEFDKKGVFNLYTTSDSKVQGNEGDSAYIDTGKVKPFPDINRKIIETVMNCIFYRARKSDTFYLNSKYNEAADILRAPEHWNRYGILFESLEKYQDHMDYINTFNAVFNKKSIPEIVKAVSKIRTSHPNLKSYIRTPKFLVWRSFISFCAMGISPTKSTASAPSSVLRLKAYLKKKQELNAAEALMYLEEDIVHSQLKDDEFVEEIITHYAKKNKQYNFLYNSPEKCELEIEKFEKNAE